MKDRDSSMDHLLRRQLQREPAGAPTGDCVDPETLAAWADGSLSTEALTGAEYHAAGCARCQAMLAAMARTLPEVTAKPWWRALTARWVVPVAAAATALVVWVAVDRQQPKTAAVNRAPRVTESRQPSETDKLAYPPSLGLSTAPAAGAAARGGTERGYALAAPKPADDRGEEHLDVTASRARPVPNDRSIPIPSSPPSESSLRASPSPAPVRPPSQPVAAPAPPAPAGPSPVATELVAVEAPQTYKVAPVPEAVLVVPETADARPRSGALGGQLQRGAIEIVSPEPAFRWRLLAPATIERSTNGGVSWTAQTMRLPLQTLVGDAPKLVVPMALTAGSAAARDVCWIAGRGGVVLLSTDGATWQRRPFPEPLNLTSVRAVDAKTATVTTEDGRQFSTTDGGATWAKIP